MERSCQSPRHPVNSKFAGNLPADRCDHHCVATGQELPTTTIAMVGIAERVLRQGNMVN